MYSMFGWGFSFMFCLPNCFLTLAPREHMLLSFQ